MLILLVLLILNLVLPAATFQASHLQLHRPKLFALNAAQVLVFGPHNCRIHDNPLLNDNDKEVIPVFIYDEKMVSDMNMVAARDMQGLISSCLEDLSAKFASQGIKLEVLRGDIGTAVSEFVDGLEDKDNTVVYYLDTPLQPVRGYFQKLRDHLVSTNIPYAVIEEEYITTLSKADARKIKPSELDYKKYGKYIESVPPTSIKSSLQSLQVAKAAAIDPRVEDVRPLAGESLALHLLQEYERLGDKGFTQKYYKDYIKMARDDGSIEHSIAMARLASPKTSTYGDFVTIADGKELPSEKFANSFFEGEVMAGLLSPLIALGCISLNKLPKGAISRKKWHMYISSLLSSSTSSSNRWSYQYRNWKGFIQREAMYSARYSDDSDNTIGGKKRPKALLVHGFGGSIDQFTGLAESLSSDFDVYALDSLGFGQSEKPPLSYNQYLWRDQVVDYAKRILDSCNEEDEKLILVGNSIGGFTVTAAAAAMEKEMGYGGRLGLVLCNSAGRLLEEPGLSNTPEEELFLPYSGPNNFILGGFGKVIFGVLQPRITGLCEWLYPSNPSAVTKQNVDVNILRDSNDPGAAGVIASGGKLPTPRPVNDLFREYSGPVLVAQGALDPLNDAKSRAEQFKLVREGVSVDLLQLGHCPMDEGPEQVGNSIKKWSEAQGILKKSSGVNSKDENKTPIEDESQKEMVDAL